MKIQGWCVQNDQWSIIDHDGCGWSNWVTAQPCYCPGSKAFWIFPSSKFIYTWGIHAMFHSPSIKDVAVVVVWCWSVNFEVQVPRLLMIFLEIQYFRKIIHEAFNDVHKWPQFVLYKVNNGCLVVSNYKEETKFL